MLFIIFFSFRLFIPKVITKLPFFDKSESIVTGMFVDVQQSI